MFPSEELQKTCKEYESETGRKALTTLGNISLDFVEWLHTKLVDTENYLNYFMQTSSYDNS